MVNSLAPVSKRSFLITALLTLVLSAIMSGSAFAWLPIMGNGVSRSDRGGKILEEKATWKVSEVYENTVAWIRVSPEAASPGGTPR